MEICGCFIFPSDTLLCREKQLIKITTSQQAQPYRPQHPSIDITMKLALLLPLLTMVFRTSHAKDAVVRGNGGRLRDLQEELSMSMSMSMLGDLSRAGVELASLEVFPASKSSKECKGTTLNIKVKTDKYPDETNAIITDLCKTPDGPFETRVGLPLLAFLYDELSEEEQAAYDNDQFDKSEHEFNYCLPKSKYSLTMFDDNGNGFVDNDAGYISGYEVSVDGITIKEFDGFVEDYKDTELQFGDCPRKKSSKSGKECKGTTLNIKVTTDEFPEDTNAIITDLCKTPDGPFETRVGLPLLAFLYDELSEGDKSDHEFNYCLPKSKYNLTMFDDFGDGFLDDDTGYEVSVDGKIIQTFRGNFSFYKDIELEFGDCPRKKSSKSSK